MRIFIDELDSFEDGESAGDDDHRDYRRQVINGLLECLDPSEGREGVVVVGATNNPDVIDRALLRSGRLETLVEIPLPDGKARVAISSPSPSSSPSETNLPNRPIIVALPNAIGLRLNLLFHNRIARRRMLAALAVPL